MEWKAGKLGVRRAGAITNNIPGKFGVRKVGRFERNFAAKQGAPNLIVNGTFGHLFIQQSITS